MATFILKTVQKIPTSLENAWSFFSNADNLRDITPQNLGFIILSNHQNAKMYPGQIIEYKIKPVFGIPIYWMTEITHVEERVFFVDEQRFGPYQLWHHQHIFSAVPGGVEMTDIVHYRNYFGLLGNIVNRLFVKKELRRIFEFRFRKIQDLFGKWDGEAKTSIEFNR